MTAFMASAFSVHRSHASLPSGSSRSAARLPIRSLALPACRPCAASRRRLSVRAPAPAPPRGGSASAAATARTARPRPSSGPARAAASPYSSNDGLIGSGGPDGASSVSSIVRRFLQQALGRRRCLSARRRSPRATSFSMIANGLRAVGVRSRSRPACASPSASRAPTFAVARSPSFAALRPAASTYAALPS